MARPYQRFIALFLSISLVLYDSGAYASQAGGWRDENVGALFMAPGRDESRPYISIPSEFGTIDEFVPCPASRVSCPTLIYIQDAHDSLEAQENISKIIHYLVEHHGVKTVFEEGYEGPVPTDKYFGPLLSQRLI